MTSIHAAIEMFDVDGELRIGIEQIEKVLFGRTADEMRNYFNSSSVPGGTRRHVLAMLAKHGRTHLFKTICAMLSPDLVRFYFRQAASYAHIQCVRMMLACCRELLDQSECVNEGLYLASGSGHTEVVQLLLQEGKANVQQHHLDHSLQSASRRGDWHKIVDPYHSIDGEEIARYINNIQLPLQHATTVKVLLEAKADVHYNDNQLVREAKHKDMVSVFLQHGADPSLVHTEFVKREMNSVGGHPSSSPLLLAFDNNFQFALQFERLLPRFRGFDLDAFQRMKHAFLGAVSAHSHVCSDLCHMCLLYV